MRDVSTQGGGINGDKQDIGGKGGGEGAVDGEKYYFTSLKLIVTLMTLSNPSSVPISRWAVCGIAEMNNDTSNAI